MAGERRLTIKQEKFIAEYFKNGGDAGKAYIDAGYSLNGRPDLARYAGWRNLYKRGCRFEIERRRKRMHDKNNVDVDRVISTIVDTIERCRQAEPVLDKEGNPTGQYTFNPMAVLKGCELLGKYLGMFTEKHKVEVEGKIEHVHSRVGEWVDNLGLSNETKRELLEKVRMQAKPVALIEDKSNHSDNNVSSQVS